MWQSEKSRSRDLSEIWESELEITIEKFGSKTFVFDKDLLATHVALVAVELTGRAVIVQNVRRSPWEIVSFDRGAKKLKVRLVKV